ncbi:MAG: hypothetical protein K0S65_4624 [Labilithrix sp.]|nr:hypothetical protein [Labilithrix sp.]
MLHRGALAVVCACTLLFASSHAWSDEVAADAGVAAPEPATTTEPCPVRLGKALAFGLVTSALLVGGGLWRRGRRRRLSRPRSQ